MPANPPALFSAEDKKRYQIIVDVWSGFLQTQDATKRKELLEKIDISWVPNIGTYRLKEYYIVHLMHSGKEFNDRHWDRSFVLLTVALFDHDERTLFLEEELRPQWRENILKEIGAGKETEDQWPAEEYELFVSGTENALKEYWDKNRV